MELLASGFANFGGGFAGAVCDAVIVAVANDFARAGVDGLTIFAFAAHGAVEVGRTRRLVRNEEIALFFGTSADRKRDEGEKEPLKHGALQTISFFIPVRTRLGAIKNFLVLFVVCLIC